MLQSLGASLLVAIVFGGAILFGGPWSFSPMHKANVREFNHNAAKVAQACGTKAADRFRTTYDPDDDSEGPMQEWVTRCTVGPRR